ncbi:MAG: hypothetical protein JXA66_03145 [Oligoflexia bacterium]|nr:hypothetical protein [Oligoflexia bacterium]
MRIELNVILNWVIFLFLSLTAIVVQTAFFNMYVFTSFAPDLLIVFVVYMGYKRALLEGIISVSVIGYLYHLHSSVSSRLIIFIFLLCFIIARYIRMTFYVDTIKSSVMMISIPVLASKILIAFWAYMSDAGSVGRILLMGLISVVLTASVGLVFFEFLNWIDNKTNRVCPYS